MYTCRRFKISESMAKASFFLLGAAFVAGLVWIGCGDGEDALTPGSDPLSPDGLTALAPGGGSGPATFTVEFDGDVKGGPTPTTSKINHGTTASDQATVFGPVISKSPGGKGKT